MLRQFFGQLTIRFILTTPITRLVFNRNVVIVTFYCKYIHRLSIDKLPANSFVNFVQTSVTPSFKVDRKTGNQRPYFIMSLMKKIIKIKNKQLLLFVANYKHDDAPILLNHSVNYALQMHSLLPVVWKIGFQVISF